MMYIRQPCVSLFVRGFTNYGFKSNKTSNIFSIYSSLFRDNVFKRPLSAIGIFSRNTYQVPRCSSPPLLNFAESMYSLNTNNISTYAVLDSDSCMNICSDDGGEDAESKEVSTSYARDQTMPLSSRVPTSIECNNNKRLEPEFGFKYEGMEPTTYGDWSHKGRVSDF